MPCQGGSRVDYAKNPSWKKIRVKMPCQGWSARFDYARNPRWEKIRRHGPSTPGGHNTSCSWTSRKSWVTDTLRQRTPLLLVQLTKVPTNQLKGEVPLNWPWPWPWATQSCRTCTAGVQTTKQTNELISYSSQVSERASEHLHGNENSFAKVKKIRQAGR